MLLLVELCRFKFDQGEIWQDCSSSLMHRLTELDCDMASYFQDSGHDKSPPLAAACAAVSIGYPLARRALVTSSTRRMRYSSWFIVVLVRLTGQFFQRYFTLGRVPWNEREVLGIIEAKGKRHAGNCNSTVCMSRLKTRSALQSRYGQLVDIRLQGY